MQKKVLQDGKLLPLSAKDNQGLHTHVLALARYTKDEIALIVINFNDKPVDATLDLKNVRLVFQNENIRNIAVIMEDWINPDEPEQYFTVEEIINY